jgi:DNA modification methylase
LLASGNSAHSSPNSRGDGLPAETALDLSHRGLYNTFGGICMAKHLEKHMILEIEDALSQLSSAASEAASEAEDLVDQIDQTDPYLHLIRLDAVEVLPRNAKDHDIEAIGESMYRWGFLEPILINTRTSHLLSGHGRVETLKEMQSTGNPPPHGIELDKKDHEWLIPCRRVDVAEDEEEAAALALNKLVEKGGWDDEKLLIVLEDLHASKKMEGTGFTLEELEDLRALLAEDEPENVPTEEDEELPESLPPQTLPGDLYKMGRHYLLCGDSTSVDHMECLLSASGKRVKPQLVWADPPYGIGYKTNHKKRFKDTDELSRFDKLSGDDQPLVEFIPLITEIPAWYICCRWDVANSFIEEIDSTGFRVVSWIVWYKPGGSMGDLQAQYVPCHETILYCAGEGQRNFFQGGVRDSDVWQLNTGDKMHYEHPTQKPVGLPHRAITNHTKSGDVIYDPFGGSGPSLEAAEKLGRTAYLMELEPKYCDIILDRWERISGKKAQLVTRNALGLSDSEPTTESKE